MDFAVIGLGLRAAHLISELKTIDPDARFVAAADPNQHETIDQILSASNALPDKRYEDAESLLANEKPDFLLIASPNVLHLGHIEQALATDIPHIFVEKPVVTTLDDTLAVNRLVHKYRAQRRLMVGLVLRYSPLYRRLLNARDQGNLGEIMSIEASEHIAPYHGSFFMRDWRRKSDMSGGFMIEKCCHDLDLYQNLVGSRPVHVASFGGRKKYVPARRTNTDPDYYKIKVPIWNGVDDPYTEDSDIIDYQTALIDYASGQTLAFHTNIHTPDEFRRFCVIGTDGMAEGDFIRQSFRVTDAETSEYLEDTPPGKHRQGMKGHYGADRQMVEDVLAFVEGKPSGQVVPVKDALEAGVTAIACDMAMAEKRVIGLADFWEKFDAALEGKS